MEMMDYPAAHSMDTHWFAVDADGRVASLYSGEAGAVPGVVSEIEGIRELTDQIRQLTSVGDWIVDVKNSTREGHQAWLHWYPVVLVMDSPEPFRADIEAGRARIVPSTEGCAVLFHRLEMEELPRYLETPGIIRSFNLFLGENQPAPLAGHGVYEYTHLNENWIAGPYGRERIPARPLHIDQLPADLRAALKECFFPNVRFSDTGKIQPVEHLHCDSWESAWLDVTGKHIRAVPGCEAEYTKLYPEMLKFWSAAYIVEPPPGAKPQESQS